MDNLSRPQDTLSNAETGAADGVSSKIDYAVRWLLTHPEDLALTGEQLERTVTPNGITISYRTWNRAKGKVAP